jgi:hypothetical protein
VGRRKMETKKKYPDDDLLFGTTGRRTEELKR